MVFHLATSNSYEENVMILGKPLERANKWAQRHSARFALDQFELIHYSNPHPSPTAHPAEPSSASSDIWAIPDDPCGYDQMSVIISGREQITIQPSEHAEYLRFSTHHKKLFVKAAGSLG